MIRQVKQMMAVGLRFRLAMLGVMKLVPVTLVPVKVAANTTVIIDDELSLRFARGSFNAESFED